MPNGHRGDQLTAGESLLMSHLIAHWGLFLYKAVQSLSHVIRSYISVAWCKKDITPALQWRHNDCDSVSIHQRLDYLLNHLIRHRSKKTSKLHLTGLCVGNSLGTGEFPAPMASNAENVSIWWRHHECVRVGDITDFISKKLSFYEAPLFSLPL